MPTLALLQPAPSRPGIIRLIASFCYDALLITAVLLAATLLFIALFGNATQPPLLYGLRLYLWLVSALYFCWCWRRSGQTLAMQTWRIRLINQAGLGLTLSQVMKRYVIATLGLLFFGAGFLWAVFDRESLFLHDRLLGTRLVMWVNT